MSQELQNVVEKPVLALLGKYKRQIEAVLPKQLTPERVLKLIVGEMNRNNALLSCTPWSVVNSVLTAASLGLEIRPNSAYLIPFGKQCTLIIDYRGKIDLVTRNGNVIDVDSEIVYSREKFRVFRNDHGFKVLEHEPLLFVELSGGDRAAVTEKDRGVPIGAYAIATMRGGEYPKFVFMPELDINKIRDRSRAKNDGPWKTDTLEMWKKTTIHRLCKLLPQSPELAKAQEVDDRNEMGISLDDVIEVEAADVLDPKPLLESSQVAQDAVADEKLAALRAEEARLLAEKKNGGLKKASDALGVDMNDLPQNGGAEISDAKELSEEEMRQEQKQQDTQRQHKAGFARSR